MVLCYLLINNKTWVLCWSLTIVAKLGFFSAIYSVTILCNRGEKNEDDSSPLVFSGCQISDEFIMLIFFHRKYMYCLMHVCCWLLLKRTYVNHAIHANILFQKYEGWATVCNIGLKTWTFLSMQVCWLNDLNGMILKWEACYSAFSRLRPLVCTCNNIHLYRMMPCTINFAVIYENHEILNRWSIWFLDWKVCRLINLTDQDVTDR